MNRICIVHFNPIEKYPPAINFLQYISDINIRTQVIVITTSSGDSVKPVSIPGIEIKRVVKWDKKNSRLYRMWLYFLYHVKSLFILKRFRPDSILYYETLSAGAPALYKRFTDRHVGIFIHYHEYTSSEQYRTGMILIRWLRRLELTLYPDTKWVSHTNEDRMRMFLNDIPSARPVNIHIFPNLPPSSWFGSAAAASRNSDPRIGFVYVGALDLETMHTREMAQLVAANNDKCYWDIFSDNHDENVLNFLSELGAKNIVFKGSVEYSKLPFILAGYDIGLILYTGFIDNHIYSIPNKLYEYYVCGLNILYPPAIKTIRLFKRQNDKPWIREMDFSNPTLPDAEDAIRIANIPETDLVAEPLYNQLLKALLEDEHKKFPSNI